MERYAEYEQSGIKINHEISSLKARLNSQALHLPDDMKSDFDATLDEWRRYSNTLRLWDADATLWSDDDESKWLGWLDLAQDMIADVQALEEFAAKAKSDGFTDVLVMGMGGSSLCPFVMAETFEPAAGYLKLHVLDSTQPDELRVIESQFDVRKTLFVVSSKSGSTLEPNIFCDYFFAKATADQFIAITDPGSSLEKLARERNFRKTFYGEPSVGGRFSALSNFGLVPMALMGIDIKELLRGARDMAEMCGPDTACDDNPALHLGLALGIAGKRGKDKVTFFCSDEVRDVQTWLEQLLAESTGKRCKGLIPIAGETLVLPEQYGSDRIFIDIRLAGGRDKHLDDALLRLQEDGHPVVRIEIDKKIGLGQEFFRWEFATAVAGSILQINPFDQPDVEASKEATRTLMSAYERDGKLNVGIPIASESSLDLFAPEGAHYATPKFKEILSVFLNGIEAGDYFAILAYLPTTATTKGPLETLRLAVGNRGQTATCLEFGPRFLHSTGQIYKGGPNTGVFLELTCDAAADLAIPNRKATFGVVVLAEAIGDFRILTQEKNRRGLHIHINGDLKTGLATLNAVVSEVLLEGDAK